MGIKENIYSVLFESIQEGLILVDNLGTIVLNNSVCERMFGYNANELLDQKIELLIPINSRKKHKEHRVDYNKKPQQRSMGANIKLNGQRKDGSVFPVQVSLNPFDDNGKKYVTALVSDVTEKRKTEEELVLLNQTLEQKVQERTKELKQSEQLYKSIARNFPGGVISIFDKDYNYLFAEGQGLFELGIETEDLIGINYLKRLESEAKSKVKNELSRVFKGESVSFEVSVNQRTYLLNAAPLFNERGEVDRILVVEKNITEEKEAKNRLEENLRAEKALNEMKSRFVSMASHEFRTPLTTINSSAALISKYYDKGIYDQTDKHVKRIKSAVGNLTTILNDFLSIEKLESGKIETKFTEFPVNELLIDVADEMGGLIRNGQKIKIFSDKQTVLKTDKQLLKNILLNLVSNALKYSPEDKDVHLHTSYLDANTFQIAVQDFGFGIPKEDQPKLFERFFRAGNVLNIEGTGLGLNIVVRYLELLGGELSFESEENIGSTFKLTLPVNR